MKKKILQLFTFVIAATSFAFTATAQNSLPAPGSGGGGGGFAQSSLPAPGSGGGYQPSGPAAGPNWGSPWYMGPMYNPAPVVTPAYVPTVSSNQGLTKVLACGYDAQGIWRVIPMLVSYQYNGVQYSVNVINAWNPWTDQWSQGVDTQAFNTAYYLKNIQYDYYTVLPWGTFYFNL